jgi:hypothetical protein
MNASAHIGTSPAPGRPKAGEAPTGARTPYSVGGGLT